MKHTVLLLALSSSLFAADPTPVKLFNGKDLTGWIGKGYTVKDGVITCKGRNLMTEKEYSNYILEFEFKLPPGGNNGLGIHYTGSGNPASNGMEIQILDDTHPKYKKLKPYQFHGGIYFLKEAKKGFLKPVGEWNREKITVNGPHVTVELNGTVINEANLEELAKSHPKHKGVTRRSGHITFCGHGDPVQFRNIQITELPDTKTPAKPSAPDASSDKSNTATPKSSSSASAPLPAGFTPIYNGKDLSGWKQDKGHEGHWQPQGEVLHYDGKSKAKDKNLWTEKSYADFTLICDWRWTGPSGKQKKRPVLDPTTGKVKRDADGKAMLVKVDELDSGIYLRGNFRSQINIWNWPCGSGEVWSYRENKRLPQEIRAALTPKVKADNPIGEWNRFEITIKGDRLTVVLNEQTVIDNAQLPGVPESGPIALQHHGSEIQFRNIAIKEL